MMSPRLRKGSKDMGVTATMFNYSSRRRSTRGGIRPGQSHPQHQSLSFNLVLDGFRLNSVHTFYAKSDWANLISVLINKL
jgi:hypothetical protein